MAAQKIHVLAIGLSDEKIKEIEPYTLEQGYYFKTTDNFKNAIHLLKDEEFGLFIYGGNHTDESVEDKLVDDVVHHLRQVQLTDEDVKIFIISPPGTSDYDFIEHSSYQKIKPIDHVKPDISKSELLKKLSEIYKDLAKEESKSSKDVDHLYRSIDIENAIKGDLKEFPRYLRLNRFKYILVAPPNTDLDDKYTKKGVKHIFVSKENYEDTFGSNVKILKKVVNETEKVTPQRKASLIEKSSSVIFDQIKFDGVDEEVFSHAKECFEASIEVSSKSNLTFSLIENLSNHQDFIFAHALGVSHIAVMIAKSMEFTNDKNLLDISLAGFMHDCGKLHLPDEIIRAPRHLLNEEDREKLKQHPLIGYKELSLLEDIPEIVCDMVYQHHEDMLGQGYPRRLSPSKICMGARILALADDFCNLTIDNPCYRKMSPKKAFSQLYATKINAYDKYVVSGLSKVINVAG